MVFWLVGFEALIVNEETSYDDEPKSGRWLSMYYIKTAVVMIKNYLNILY